MSDIRCTYEFESVPDRFVFREQDTWVQDEFCDEICLIIEEQGELAVTVGCNHPGILNILTTVREYFSRPIKAAIGEAHLMEADKARVCQAMEITKGVGIRLPGFNHCSEELFGNMMEQEETLFTVCLRAGDYLFLM